MIEIAAGIAIAYAPLPVAARRRVFPASNDNSRRSVSSPMRMSAKFRNENVCPPTVMDCMRLPDAIARCIRSIPALISASLIFEPPPADKIAADNYRADCPAMREAGLISA